jgi:hypothetical protein
VSSTRSAPPRTPVADADPVVVTTGELDGPGRPGLRPRDRLVALVARPERSEAVLQVLQAFDQLGVAIDVADRVVVIARIAHRREIYRH